MYWITTHDRPTAPVTVHSVHTSEAAARTKGAADRAKALPVNAARPGSQRPKKGDVLPVMDEASGPVAVALTK